MATSKKTGLARQLSQLFNYIPGFNTQKEKADSIAREELKKRNIY
jgi:hypothetical protein